MQPRAALSRPRAILKDWDGTVVDSLARVHDAHNQVLREFDWPEVTFEQTIRMTAYGARCGVEVLGMSEELGALMAKRFSEVFFKFDPSIKVLPGADVFFATFGGTTPIGIVSNKHGNVLRDEINHFGWQQHIGSVVAFNEASANKPSPAPALLALQQLGIEPGPDIWFVGDTHGDVQCALAAGLTPILVTTHSYAGPAPAFRFNSLIDLVSAYHASNTETPGIAATA